MKYVLLFVAGAGTLAACNQSPKVDEKNATTAEVAQKVREAGFSGSMVRPGLWQSKVTIEKFDMPGMPPEMAQRMKATMAESQGHDFQACLTPQDVKQPKEDFFAGRDNECRYDHFTMGDGKIDALMHCGKGATTMRMAGTYSPESYRMQMATEIEASDEAEHAMQMQMRVEAHRVGECSAKQG